MGGGHAGGGRAGQDDVVPNIAHHVGGGGGWRELVNVSNVELGGWRHQEHSLQPGHTGVPPCLSLPVAPDGLDLDLHPVTLIIDFYPISLVTFQRNPVVDPADFLI